jgi:hypothetical protein
MCLAAAIAGAQTNVPLIATVPVPITPGMTVPQAQAVEGPLVPKARSPYDPLPPLPKEKLMTPPGPMPSGAQIISESLRRPIVSTSPIRTWDAMVRSQQVAKAAAPQIVSNTGTFTKPIMFNTPEADAILAKLQVFPKDNLWNTNISNWPLHLNSTEIIRSMGTESPLRCNEDMGFILVPPNQPRVTVKIVDYPDESDPGPYPVPNNAPIEGWPMYPRGTSLNDAQEDKAGTGGDRHCLVVDPVNGMLYEFFVMKRVRDNWQAAQASVFDLKSNKLRPNGWTSSDAAGLPVFPAVVRYDDVVRGIVNHAMRVTVRRTRRAYVAPATHYASRLYDLNLPRMGERIRLKKDFNIDGFSPEMQAVLKGLKKYGMFVADNGIDWAISVAPDERIPPLGDQLRRLHGYDFEVVVAP